MNSMTIDLMGIYVPTMGVLAALALVLTVALRQVLNRFDFFSLFWHRGLVEVSIFVLLLGCALLLTLGPGLPALALFSSLFHF